MRLYTLLSLCAAVLPLSCTGCGTEPPAAAQRTPATEPPAAAAAATETEPEPESPAVTDEPPAAYNELTPDEARVLLEQGTELAGTGEYTDLEADGTYICRQCNAQLYHSQDKCHSGCGWPSYDDEIPGAIERHEDTSFGWVRTEIVCKNCKGHLGHVFFGERMTDKDTRHCVN
jgi:methionine-R-sulfoxide reductase